MLRIDGGGTYDASAVVSVPRDEEVTIRYPVVEYDRLPDAERTNVDRGDADLDVYVNGERRSGA